MRPRSVVFIVTREVRVPKKIEQTRKILSDLIQWKVGQGYISFHENTKYHDSIYLWPDNGNMRPSF